MLFYDPHSFYKVVFSRRGSLIPRCLPHALCFGAIGAGAAYLAESGYLTQDLDEVNLVCGLVMSLLVSFRLSFAFSRYEEAVVCVGAIQSTARELVSKLCAHLEPEDAESAAAVLRVKRYLVLVFLLVEARVQGDSADFDQLEALGIVTSHERGLMTHKVATAMATPTRARISAADADEQPVEKTPDSSFPSKARVALVLQLLLREASLLHRTGKMPVANMWASVDTTIGQLSQTASELECMLSKLLPFCYANCIKSIILLYISAFPFGVANELGWGTVPAAALCALIFLVIDQVGAVMESPFDTSMTHGIDMQKRIRRTDKELASLVGCWLGTPATHFDLYPETARAHLAATGKRHFHRDNHRVAKPKRAKGTRLNLLSGIATSGGADGSGGSLQSPLLR